MSRTTVSRFLAAAAALLASAFLLQTVAVAGPPETVVDQTIAGPLGGAELCVLGAEPENCAEVQGIRDLRVTITRSGDGLTGPGVKTGSAPGCTNSVNIAFDGVSPGSDSTYVVTVSYIRTDKNGVAVPGTESSTSETLEVEADSQEKRLFSVCTGAL